MPMVEFIFLILAFKELSSFSNNTTPIDFGHDVFPFMIKNNLPIFAYKFSDFLLDIGQPDNYQLANNQIKYLNL